MKEQSSSTLVLIYCPCSDNSCFVSVPDQSFMRIT
ncbi:hypothetical protein LINPERPRIM_LOCUS6758 [Linum perenne]